MEGSPATQSWEVKVEGSQVTVHTATLIRGLHITPSLHPVAGITSPDPVMPHHIWPGLRSHVIVFPTVIFRIVIHHAYYHCVGDICCRDMFIVSSTKSTKNTTNI